MKQMEYTVKVTTNGTVDTKELQRAITELKTADAFPIASVEVTNFRIVKQAKK